MDIGAVLSRAWQIVWKHKVLWIFGILAGCGKAGWNTSSFRSSYRGQSAQQFQQFFSQMSDAQIAILIFVLLAIVLVLAVIFIFLGTVGRIGLIRGTLQADAGAERLEFSELFSGSLPYFWRIFFLNLLVGLAITLVVFFIILLGTLGTIFTLGLFLICFIPFLCLLGPLAWLVSILLEQANIAIVAENKGILDGLERAWEVFRTNLGMYIVMGLILILGVGLIVGFIVGLPLALIAGPAILGLLSGGQGLTQSGIVISALCLVAYIPVLILINGIVQGFVTSSWTLTFKRLTAPAAI